VPGVPNMIIRPRIVGDPILALSYFDGLECICGRNQRKIGM